MTTERAKKTWLKYIRKEWYTNIEAVPCCFNIEEEDKDGKASIELRFNNPIISIDKLTKTPIKWIECNKSPDSLIIEFLPDNTVKIHVIEIKKSVNNDNLNDARIQICTGVLIGLCVVGLLNLQLNTICLCIAYCNENMDAPDTNPVLNENPDAELDFRSPWVFWESNIIDLGIDCIDKLRINKIHMNTLSEGTMTCACCLDDLIND